MTEDEALNAEIHQIKEFSERCGGIFDEIDEVFSESERKDFMAKYKQAAGFAIENLNSSPPTIQV